MKMKFAIGVGAFLLGAMGTAMAAESVTLTDVGGSVLVNRGQGFQAVSSATAMHAGDRVLLRSGGVATLDYGAGCRVKLNVGVPVSVASASPCVQSTAQTGTSDSKTTGALFLLGAAGGAGAVIGLSNSGSNTGPVCITGACQ
ncbi:hypothetical protein MWN34_01575 [Ancylobacter sp. 6x-1]|uniref:Uncharacterized protein n=1 Tax=Ancylobacter crimeensis TaxID=2579147 RepID=A0ABT0D6M2_9HYPH|nr:hypothetical protein [Ancylobacter crimeensis]MCK0195595.1 hypothetical protein [Ancylobacter crimeensis]